MTIHIMTKEIRGVIDVPENGLLGGAYDISNQKIYIASDYNPPITLWHEHFHAILHEEIDVYASKKFDNIEPELKEFLFGEQ